MFTLCLLLKMKFNTYFNNITKNYNKSGNIVNYIPVRLVNNKMWEI